MFTRGKKEEQEEIQKPQEEFEDFNLFEYNLFWFLHFLMVLCTVSYLGADLSTSLEKFFQMINPLNWL